MTQCPNEPEWNIRARPKPDAGAEKKRNGGSYFSREVQECPAPNVPGFSYTPECAEKHALLLADVRTRITQKKRLVTIFLALSG